MCYANTKREALRLRIAVKAMSAYIITGDYHDQRTIANRAFKMADIMLNKHSLNDQKTQKNEH